MAIFSHTNTNFILSSIKVVVIISTAVAGMLKLSVPLVTDFARSEVPFIWRLVASWLRPPYLYLVINCIIITIVASSKLQSKFEFHDHDSSFSPLETLLPVHPHPIKMNPVDSRTEEYGGGEVFKGEFEYGYDPKSRISETKTTFTVNASEEMQLDARVSENALEATDDFVISKSSWNALDKDPMELSKPPASARFSHRKVVKTTSEGGKTLRVSKPKRHDTMESTWKTITDGRPMPLTRHLMRKSWETHGGHHHPNDGDDLEDDKNNKMMMMMMTKSETTTFNDRRRINSLSSGSSGKLRKDPSLSEEELNKRVEAFIMRI